GWNRRRRARRAPGRTACLRSQPDAPCRPRSPRATARARRQRPAYASACEACRSALCEAALEVLGVIEVRRDCRPYFLDQPLKLGVLGAGNQRLVDRVEHRLMVGDFVVDVGLVEFGAFELLKVRDVFLGALL